MTTQVTLNIPDDVYQRAEQFARLANRDISSVLADTIAQSIPLLSAHINTLPTVTELTHDQLLALTELQLEPEQDAQLSHLLDQQQAGTLNAEAHLELEALMQIYQEGLLRKATALAEAVKRGLIPPLS
jgi:ABC-type transporter Mla subunit MlaD